MKIRLHRGSLAESMTTAEECEPTMGAVIAFLQEGGIFAEDVDTVRVKPYKYDPRIGWDTHIIMVDGYPAGWTDGPLK